MEIAGITTAVLEGGQGPPLVLLHGPKANATHWMRVIPGLAQTHRVVAPDLPGHGKSVRTGRAPIDSGRMMAWLRELIAATCEEAPYVTGHALGGAIAARFACSGGDKLRGLALVDSFGLAPRIGMPAIPAADLAGILAPVTVIWGRHDEATPLATAEKACARHGWPLHIIEDCNDDPAVEQPEAMLKALRAALEAA
jgi:pimeloyl-ACP methyl ester carboxylesterase